MGLKEDARKIFMEMLGGVVAKQLDSFDNPEKYPNDFLDECKYFLAQIIGETAAEERLAPLYKKYSKNREK